VNKNAEIVTAFAGSELGGEEVGFPGGLPHRAIRRLIRGGNSDETPKSEDKSAATLKPNIEELAKLHPGFRSSRSMVLHRFGTDPHYRVWLARLLGQILQVEGQVATTRADQAKLAISQLQIKVIGDSRVAEGTLAEHGDFVLLDSQWNTPPLFGTGLINAVPGAVLEGAARKSDSAFPEVQGRVSRLKDGRIGRFGRKGQTAGLKDFVLTACAVELGLEVPGQSQACLPTAPHYKTAGPDMEASECDALVAYVRGLPAQSRRGPSSDQESRTIEAGRESFAKVGYASCHSPNLGPVEGIYSDLLLHDMGPELGDSGSYSVTVPDSPNLADNTVPTQGNLAPTGKTAQGPDDGSAWPRFGAHREEWRKPALWGFRDSGPYLHDSRAATLEQSVALHGGQTRRSAEQFFLLSSRERLQIETFLKSLTAPIEITQVGN
jgi:Di-haem oxidoreductase, putative peroxidase